MKTIIAGSRTINDYNIIKSIIEESGFNITEVICGGARGVDDLGRKWANNKDISIKLFPAKWDTYNKSAGYKRNIEMAEYADAAIIIWNGISKGTKHMIDTAKKYNLKTFVKVVNYGYNKI